MTAWRRIASERIRDCGIFDLHRARFVPPEGGDPRWFYVIDAPSWVNVIPLTDDDEVLMVRQFRFGIGAETLEIPGGMCEADEDPAIAAARELLEETGHEAGVIEPIGWVHPNPPIQSNRCFSFLARELRAAGAPRPDPDERVELVRIPLTEVPRRIVDGTITHALVLAAFQLFENRGRQLNRRGDS